MSASKRAYEGPDPAQLLLEVWSNHGTEAQISEPERIRKGGVLGFFSTSVYRVEVHEGLESGDRVVTDLMTTPEPTATNATDQTSKRSSRSTTPRAPLPARPPLPDPTSGPQAQPKPRPDPIGVPSGLASLIEETPDTFERTPVPRLSFDAVLEDVVSSLGADPTAFDPPQFSDELPECLAGGEILEEDGTEEETPSSVVYDSLDELVRRAMDSQDIETPISSTVSATVAPTPLVASPAAAAPVDPPVVFPARDIVAPVLPSPPVGTGARDVTARLESIGYPIDLLAPLMGTPLFPTCFEDAFALLGPAPTLPRTNGALLAVVAAPGEVLELARRLASAHRIDPDTVALVARPRSVTLSLPPARRTARSTPRPSGATRPPDGFIATDLASLRQLCGGWRRDRIGIVAVELATRGRSHKAVRATLRALAPSAVWLAADARMKNEDLLATVDGIGGADALLLEHVTKTSTPAASLACGIAIATLDNRRADVARWVRIAERASEG